jgi:hypothetical protein
LAEAKDGRPRDSGSAAGQRPRYTASSAADAVRGTFGRMPTDDHDLCREAGVVFIHNLVAAEEFTDDGGDQSKPIEKGTADGVSGARRVPNTYMDKVNTVFTAANFVARAWTVLRDNRIVILQGHPGVGKATAAMHLLMRCAVTEIRVIDPEAGPQQLMASEFARDRGYLFDGLSAEAGRALSEFVLSSVQARLADTDACAVLTVDAGVELRLGEYAGVVVACDSVEDVARLLDRHIDWYLRDRDPAVIRRRRPSDIPGVQALLQSRPAPAELDQLGMLLAEAACGDMTEQDAVDRFAANAVRSVDDWFAGGRDLAECALLIAIAALGGASYDDVIEAAAHLERAFVALERRQGARSAVNTDSGPAPISRTGRSRQLHAVRAQLVRSHEMTPLGSMAVEAIHFENPAWHSAVLEHVWCEQTEVRPALIAWLRDRCRSNKPPISVRAAFALGELCGHQVSDLWPGIVAQWPDSPDERLRMAAALASSVPACSDALAPQVLRALLQWSSDAGSWRRRWTAAFACGSYWIGLKHPDVALRGLELVAWSEDMRLLPVFATSAAGLFALGTGHQVRVLRALGAWWRGAERSAPVRRSALFAFIKIAVDVDGGDPTGVGTRWPAVLQLMDSGQDGAQDAVTLWTRSLDDRGTREVALEALRTWVERSESDATMRQALVRQVCRLALAGGERGRRRLVSNLEQWANHPGRPSAGARTLLDALERGS